GVVAPTHVPTASQEDAIHHTLGANAPVYVEHGFKRRYGIVLLALIGAAGLVTVAGTSIAAALSMSESRPEMATLAAVGASPSRRRRQAMAQAATVGVLGAALGLALGSMLGIGLMGGSTRYPFTVPVRSLLLVTAAAPALAIAVAGLVTRGRLPLARRVA
ncbi:MAG TPA: FtsX-like permease family protein, partial [Mycobacteriales bacterium]|nr:FtsX-like permease family protein [Mycobacteriales bacterium]